MKRLTLILALFALLGSVASAADFYYAATSAGSNNGTSCANAYAYNDGTNGWNASAKQAADNVLHSCGVFTFGAAAQPIAFVNSGTSGHPITLQFESGSTWSAPYFSSTGAVIMDGHNFITVSGVTACGWVAQAEVTCTEYIQNTANGTSLANQQNSVAFSYSNSANVTIKNVGVFNLYVRTGTVDQHSWGFCGLGYGNNLTVQNTTAHDLVWCWQETPAASTTVSGAEFKNNLVYHMDHGFVLNSNSASANVSSTYIHDNSCRDFSLWDDTSGANSYHHDCVHTYANSGGGTLSNIYIYNNNGSGSWGTTVNAFIYAEGTTQNYYIFNNYINPSGDYQPFASGYIGIVKNSLGTCSGINVFNNTLIANSTANGVAFLNSPNGAPVCTGLTWENNITQTFFNVYSDNVATGTKTSNNNVFWQINNSGGGDPFKWNNTFYGTFASYKTGSGQDSASVITDPKLNANGTLQAGSSAIGLGANLFSTCNGQSVPGLGALCSDLAGVARPNAAWDAGAYEFSSSTSSGASIQGSVTIKGNVVIP